VPQDKSFHGLLQDELVDKCNVYSFGMSGAPLSQYVAWMKHANRNYTPFIFVFNIIGNDFDERYRGTMTRKVTGITKGILTRNSSM